MRNDPAIGRCGNASMAGSTQDDVNCFRPRPEHRIVYRGHAVLITDLHGQVGGGKDGFYLHRTRSLFRLRLRIDGQEPRCVSANLVDRHSLLAYYFASSPAGAAAGPPPAPGDQRQGGEIAEKAIEVQVRTHLEGRLRQDIEI